MPIYTMSIFSRFKRAKKTVDTDKELPPLPIEARLLQFDTKPLPTPLIVCAPQDWPLLATPVIPVQEEPQPKTPTSPTRFSPEEAQARIAAIKKRKSEMSLRATSPPKRYYAKSHFRADSFEPPSRPLQRVRSDMSLRVPVPREPARPKTSSGHSTRSSRSTRYVDNYSFYAHNRSPLQEFGPTATSTSFPAPQVPRTRSFENLSSSRKSPRTFQNMRRPSLLHLTMEEEPAEYRSSSSRWSQDSSQSSNNPPASDPMSKLRRLSNNAVDSISANKLRRLSNNAVDSLSAAKLRRLSSNAVDSISTTKLRRLSSNAVDSISASKIPRFSKMRSLPALRHSRPSISTLPPPIATEISSPYCVSDLNLNNTTTSTTIGYKPSTYARSQRSPKSPKSPIPTWRYEDFVQAPPPLPITSPVSSAPSLKNQSRRSSISTMFSRRNGSAIFAN